MLPGYELPRKTRIACKVLKWTTVLVGIALIWYYFSKNGAAEVIDKSWNELSKIQKDAVIYTDTKKAILKIIGTLAWLNTLLYIFGIYCVFSALGKGVAFALPVVKAIRRLGFLIVAYVLIDIAIIPAMLIAMTYNSVGDDTRLLYISATTFHARTLLLGLLFLLIGHIFTQAVRISDENRQIV